MKTLLAIMMLGLATAPLAALAQGFPEPGVVKVEAKPLPAALGGYCVVSLRDRQEWQPGLPRWSHVFDGQRYQFASRRERDIFAATPQTYVPILGGDCPVTFGETGSRVRGALDYGVLHGGRLAFFASQRDREHFLDHAVEFANVDVALGGQCIVSLRNERRTAPGIPATATIFRGLRYHFVSDLHRKLFEKHPASYVDGQATVTGDYPIIGPSPGTLRAEAYGEGEDDEIIRRPTPWAPIAGRAIERPQRLGTSGGQDVILGALPAMAGYCPVTLRTSGLWTRGRYEYRVELGDQVFLTAGAKERDALAADPAAYIPAMGGDCVVSFQSRQERVRGSVYHAFEYDGRLFLFADAERKAIFKASPATYAGVDVAAGGMCVVTREDAGRDVLGLPAFAAWHAGRLYRFASDEQKQRFLADIERYAVVQ